MLEASCPAPSDFSFRGRTLLVSATRGLWHSRQQESKLLLFQAFFLLCSPLTPDPRWFFKQADQDPSCKEACLLALPPFSE